MRFLKSTGPLLFMYSSVKEIIQIRLPDAISNDSRILSPALSDLLLKFRMANVNSIIIPDNIKGAKTGPTHGTGIRKSMSQVNTDCGQPRKT